MSAELDRRNLLEKMVCVMSDSDIRQLLAYTAGYEAGKMKRASLCAARQSAGPDHNRSGITAN